MAAVTGGPIDSSVLTDSSSPDPVLGAWPRTGIHLTHHQQPNNSRGWNPQAGLHLLCQIATWCCKSCVRQSNLLKRITPHFNKTTPVLYCTSNLNAAHALRLQTDKWMRGSFCRVVYLRQLNCVHNRRHLRPGRTSALSSNGDPWVSSSAVAQRQTIPAGGSAAAPSFTPITRRSLVIGPL